MMNMNIKDNTKPFDIASVSMALLLCLSLCAGSFVIVMKNRISPMQHIGMSESLGGFAWIPPAAAAVMLLLASVKGRSERINFITGLLASIFAGGAIWLCGTSADILTEGKSSAFRVTFGVGIYIILFACYGIIVKCQGYVPSVRKRTVMLLAGILLTAALFPLGAMDKTSVMIEYYSRSAKFISCLNEHLRLCAAVIISAIIIGLPAGYLCYRYKPFDFLLTGFLNIVRSIPAIGLIIVMVTPLSMLRDISFFKELGIGAFGFAPVFCALFCYALFQIVNSLSGALKTVDPALLRTARAMGMTDAMIMTRIQIPIVLPVLISGIRVAMISTFTGASLGALVGFGGLGVLIEMGSSGGAVALDMILLGSVPIMIMIFAADFALRKLGSSLERRVSGVRSGN